ncbi:MAG: SagB/ThcOx family dehydrogenase [Pseudomonadota bacterium]
MSNHIDDTTNLSRFFHLNSGPWVNENPVPNAPFQQKTKSYAHVDRVSLPDTQPGLVDQLAQARHSQRSFADTPMPLTTCAALLRTAYAALGPSQALGNRMLRRPTPSAGGLYPLEVYALVRNVTGLAPGIYHYDAIGDDLAVLSQHNWESEGAVAFLSWDCVASAPLILCLGAEFARTQTKYGARGYRFVLFEAGHVVQNLCLAAQEQGLGSLCMGGFYDDQLNRLIGLDGEAEAAIYAVAIGAPAP